MRRKGHADLSLSQGGAAVFADARLHLRRRDHGVRAPVLSQPDCNAFFMSQQAGNQAEN